MKCPYCGKTKTEVVDTRPSNNYESIRRRRRCLECNKRFTTYERHDKINLMVVKNDSRREAFDREKVLKGILKACEKREVSMEQIEKVVDEIETTLNNTMSKEVKSSDIGELIMDRLRDLDEVAYVRFASVYRDFRDASTFVDEVKNLQSKKAKEKNKL